MSNENIEIQNNNETEKNSVNNQIRIIIIRIIVLIICFLILYPVWLKIDEKMNYSQETLYDNDDTNTVVMNFFRNNKWKQYGKVTLNPKSVPNYKTFFVAIVNPKERAEIQYFSTQFETDIKETEVYKLNENIPEKLNNTQQSTNKISEEYMLSVLKKMNPKAENIKIVKNFTKNSKNLPSKYKYQKKFLEQAYMNMNPATIKSKSSINDVIAEPVSILFSYYEDGYHYYQRFDCDFLSFLQVFDETMKTKKIKQEIQYTKCADVYSYKALAKYYKKNLRVYNVFRKNTNVNSEWIEVANEKRREILHSKNYSTTQTIMAGDKFKPEYLKNLIFTIEYMDPNNKKYLADDLKIKI